MKRKTIIKIAAFAVIFLLLAAGVTQLMQPKQNVSYQYMRGFYNEPDNTLDAIYIGSSAVYSAWLAPLAWERYGFTSWSLSSSAQPLSAARYLIENARKTQPDAVFMIDLLCVPSLGGGELPIDIHRVTDVMPWSGTKVRAIREMSQVGGLDSLEYFLPLVRFHSRWSELSSADLNTDLEPVKGAGTYVPLLWSSEDVSKSVVRTSLEVALPEAGQTVMDELLDYCRAEKIKAVFVNPLAVVTDEGRNAQVNTAMRMCREAGFPVLDLPSLRGEMGIDLTKDYYEKPHTNIHGAIKMTSYVSQYLVENYGLKDKRGDASYADWDAAYETYSTVVSPCVLDVEWLGEARDVALAAPVLNSVDVSGGDLTVRWSAVAGADGYRVYRRNDAAVKMAPFNTTSADGWTPLATVGADTLSYTDIGLPSRETYHYTVIAYREAAGETLWGDYDFTGLSATATLPAPELLELTGGDGRLTITWGPSAGADGYNVYSKVPGKSWTQLARMNADARSYTDTGALTDLPLQYTVRPYYMDGENRVLGSYATEGLLWLPEMEMPLCRAQVGPDGAVTLSWDGIEGITGYKVCRAAAGEGKKTLCSDLGANSTGLRDIIAQSGVGYSYEVTAYLTHDGERYEFALETEPGEVTTDVTAHPDGMPAITFLEQVGGSVCLSWEPVDNATYRIYRRAQVGADGAWGDWTVVQTLSGQYTALDTPSVPGEYEYAIQVVFKAGDITYYGRFDADAGEGVSFQPAR